MRWIFKFISDNPDVQKKLFESLRSFHAAAVTEDHLPTHSEICNASIPYLDAVVEESLPLSHTAIFQDRECTEDAIILGHYIPKGLDIEESIRSPTCQAAAQEYGFRAWDEKGMDEFYPERWLMLDDNGRAEFNSLHSAIAVRGPMAGAPYLLGSNRLPFFWNLYWPEKSAQLLRFVSDRTGIISLANFPLLWLFGMRNDVLIWMTGWGFGTYNAFHRWVARVATVQAVLHSVGYTAMILSSGGWPSFSQYWKEHYFWNGEIATIAMCALIVFSVYSIRRQHYDFFLVTHIALSVAVLWTMYYHVEIFTAGEWNIFIWPCAAFWILDRALRLARIFAFNRRPLSTSGKATYDACSNLVRLDVDGSKSLLAARPGSYYYVHVLDDMRYAHQSHPFTLAFVSPDATSSTITPLTPLSPSLGNTEDPPDSSTESDTLLSNNVPKVSSNLVFLIRPYNGLTSRLKSSCLLHPRKIRVLVDGPYGHVAPLRTFANVLFVVGGTGIAIPLSHLSGLVTGSSQVLHIKIVWAVRERAFLTTLLRDFHSVLGNKRVDMEIHVTRDVGHDDEILDKDLKNVRIATQRPNVYQVVKEAAENARRESLAVVCCGPALMADQARRASVQMLGMGHTGIEYFEESFKW
ncbi:hypothetical protein BM1_04811 [Bipolaris maydis]|nr:hypothetical protein BM1_04811 [Bipolaris maydis]